MTTILVVCFMFATVAVVSLLTDTIKRDWTLEDAISSKGFALLMCGSIALILGLAITLLGTSFQTRVLANMVTNLGTALMFCVGLLLGRHHPFK